MLQQWISRSHADKLRSCCNRCETGIIDRSFFDVIESDVGKILSRCQFGFLQTVNNPKRSNIVITERRSWRFWVAQDLSQRLWPALYGGWPLYPQGIRPLQSLLPYEQACSRNNGVSPSGRIRRTCYQNDRNIPLFQTIDHFGRAFETGLKMTLPTLYSSIFDSKASRLAFISKVVPKITVYPSLSKDWYTPTSNSEKNGYLAL